jgi:hypothetical protein
VRFPRPDLVDESDDVAGELCTVRPRIGRLVTAAMPPNIDHDHLKVRGQCTDETSRVPALERFAEAVYQNNGRTVSKHLIANSDTSGMDESIFSGRGTLTVGEHHAKPEHGTARNAHWHRDGYPSLRKTLLLWKTSHLADPFSATMPVLIGQELSEGAPDRPESSRSLAIENVRPIARPRERLIVLAQGNAKDAAIGALAT